MRLFFFIALCCLSFAGLANSIIGGELYYDYLGTGSYRLNVKLYRDCSIGADPYDNSISINIYNSAGVLQRTKIIAFSGLFAVQPVINAACYNPPNVCVDYGLYKDTIVLSPVPGGYYVAYQRCCRNGQVINISNPSATGSTYVEHIDPSVVNSSPRFTDFPPTFICDGSPLSFNQSATDPDGDLLSYQFCSPYTAQPPPFTNVSFISPYDGTYQLSSNPAVQVDGASGHVFGTPNIVGIWATGICANEFRNGALIGSHMRDFQFNVQTCPKMVSSVIAPQTDPCQGLTVHFANSSANASSYGWNFGDPGVITDTSNLANPAYTFPDTGSYAVTLTSYGSNAACKQTTTQVFTVYPLLQPSFARPAGECLTGNSYSFAATGQFATYSTFSWNFSSFANPATSQQQAPSGISYAQAGKFAVVLTVKEKSCVKTYTDTISVYPPVKAEIELDTAKGCPPLFVAFHNESSAGSGQHFTWYFGDGTKSFVVNPTHLYADSGKYTVSLVMKTDSGCVGKDSVAVKNLVQVLNGPKASFKASPLHTTIYENNVTFADSSRNYDSMVFYTGDGDSYTSVPLTHSYGDFGNFEATQVVMTANGCTDTARVTIKIDADYTFYIPNCFTPNDDNRNETFGPVAFGIEEYEMIIYDRWGSVMYTSSDLSKGWDGKIMGGKVAAADVYIYKISFMDRADQRFHYKSGQFNLLH